MWKRLLLLTLLLLLTSCAPGRLFAPILTPTPSSTASQTPTRTIIPSSTLTPTNTPIPVESLHIYPTADNLEQQINILEINSSALLSPDKDKTLVNYLDALGDIVANTQGHKQAPTCQQAGPMLGEGSGNPSLTQFFYRNAEVGAITKVMIDQQKTGLLLTLKCAMENNATIGPSVLQIFFTPEMVSLNMAQGIDSFSELQNMVNGTSEHMYELIQLSDGGPNNPLKFTQQAFNAWEKTFSYSYTVGGVKYTESATTFEALTAFLSGDIKNTGLITMEQVNSWLLQSLFFAWAGSN